MQLLEHEAAMAVVHKRVRSRNEKMGHKGIYPAVVRCTDDRGLLGSAATDTAEFQSSTTSHRL